jgi:hypothetical protein
MNSMGRRKFLLQSASAVSLPAVLADGLETVPAHPVRTRDDETDVLVVGGGTAGTIAAIQAARAGAATMLIEKGSQLGGTTTTAGVSFPGLFHAWGRQVISGIGWDLVRRTVELDHGSLPDFSKPYGKEHWRHQVRINGPLYAVLAEEACLQAGVRLCFYEFPLQIKPAQQGWNVEIVGKGTRRTVRCRQVIDCSGGADITAMAGFARLREKETQPGTLIFRLSGYDYEKLDKEIIEKKYLQAMADGALYEGDCQFPQGPFMGFLAKGGENGQHVYHADSSTAQTQTEANIKGRQSLLRLLKFVKTLPGCEQTKLDFMAVETGVRETFRIVGNYQISQDDYVSGRVFTDSLCYSFYPIDIHDRAGVKPKQLAAGVVPTVPLAALIPLNSTNLLVAGRSVSSDRLANSALRVQASCMAMGQAAGATAALAAKFKTTPLQVPVQEIKEMLRANGAIVPSAR